MGSDLSIKTDALSIPTRFLYTQKNS